MSAELHALKAAAGASTADIAAATGVDASSVRRWFRGDSRPTRVEHVEGLAAALGTTPEVIRRATGQTPLLLAPDLNPDDQERVTLSLDSPTRIDAQTIILIDEDLKVTRRHDDVFGSMAVMPRAAASFERVEQLIAQAPTPELRAALARSAAEWAQFAGWLASNMADMATSLQWLQRAAGLAMEAGDSELLGMVESYRGHAFYRMGNGGAVVRYSEASARHKAHDLLHAFYQSQIARGYAMMGDESQCERHLDRSRSLAQSGLANKDSAPSYAYWYTDPFYRLTHGVALSYLTDSDKATRASIAALASGLDAMPEHDARSEWTVPFRHHLARVYGRVGAADMAAKALRGAYDIVSVTKPSQVTRDLQGLSKQMLERYPDDPAVQDVAGMLATLGS